MVYYREWVSKDCRLPVYIFGCGMWGKRCFYYMQKNHIDVAGFLDNDKNKQGSDFCGKKVLNPDDVLQAAEKVEVIVAINQREEVINQLRNYHIYDPKIYSLGQILESIHKNLLGVQNNMEFKAKILEKNISVVGGGKYKEDFLYLFDTLAIENEYAENAIPKYIDEDSLLIVCSFNRENVEERLCSLGYTYGKNWLYGEDLFCLLDDYAMPSIGRYPSAMAYKTLYDPMQDQPICSLPFRNLQISSRFSVHTCCSDWGDEIGNLEYSSLDEIWNSINLKIFRLSVINRTYSFCNHYTCVHLNMNAGKTEKRMSPVPALKPYASRLEIGIDRTCNLYCESCRKEVCIEKGRKRERVENVKNKILSSGWLENTDKLLLGGQGEVFFSQVYKDIMFENAGKRKSLDLRTNGTLFDEAMFDRLSAIYENLSIIVSIDAARKETFDRLRRSHNPNTWNDLMKNLDNLSAMRKAQKISFFQINMCVQMMNYKEIPDFIWMGKKLGVDKVYITPIRNWGTYSENDFINIQIYDRGKRVKKEVQTVLNDPALKEPEVLCVI